MNTRFGRIFPGEFWLSIPNKAVYSPGETAFLQMGVLDDTGHTLCDAELSLEISAPNGEISRLTTANGLILINENCNGNSVIEGPDYFAYYETNEPGYYKARITAITKNGEKEIVDGFYVEEDIAFDLERIGPTRIYPPADYEMTFKIRPKEDYFRRIQRIYSGRF
jgi:hypothetical protein